MAGPYSYVTRKSDTLAADMAAGATSATLTSGNFGTPARTMILTIDGDVPAKAADFEVTASTNSVTSMVLLNGPDVIHTAGATVWAGLVDDHLEGLTDFTATLANQAWTAWTPTITGFSANPTLTARYKKIGTVCHISVYTVANGTSNATTFTLTLPFAAANVATNQFGFCEAVDNSSASVGLVSTQQNSNVLTVYPTVARGSWTASGFKRAIFNFTYETV